MTALSQALAMLELITPQLFGVRSRIRVAPGLWFPLRCTVVRLVDGGLVLHSPVAFTVEQRAAIDALGPVRALIAPSALHHLHLPAAAAAWPDAEVWVAPGVPQKHPELGGLRVLGERTPFFEGELTPLPIDGMPSVQERVFLHGASRTLLVTDLLFNLHRYETVWSRTYFWLCGVHGRLAQSPVVRLLVKDRAAAGASVRRVLAHAIERVVPCHGEVAEGDPSSALARMAAWGAPRLG